jgi:hypothetical protein
VAALDIATAGLVAPAHKRITMLAVDQAVVEHTMLETFLDLVFQVKGIQAVAQQATVQLALIVNIIVIKLDHFQVLAIHTQAGVVVEQVVEVNLV